VLKGMANEEQLRILKQGSKIWNTWVKHHSGVKIDLAEVELPYADLPTANLLGADLSYANLANANLMSANLRDADLSNAILEHAHLDGTNFEGASFVAAYVDDADFSYADLTNANMDGASISGTHFQNTELSGSNWQNAMLGATVFDDVDLSNVRGLEEVGHLQPSTIGINTIYRSKGKIPLKFLREAGVPENFIEYMNSLVGKAFDYYSCFISYSNIDEDFAKRLHADLQAEGVRCWFAPEDLKIGQKIRTGIDEAIKVHDKLLLILSESSVKSSWVEKEVETAFEKERRENKVVLFPVRVDDSVMETEVAWGADIRRTRHIGDFRKWKNHVDYKKGFERLMRDLKAENKPPQNAT